MKPERIWIDDSEFDTQDWCTCPDLNTDVEYIRADLVQGCLDKILSHEYPSIIELLEAFEEIKIEPKKENDELFKDGV